MSSTAPYTWLLQLSLPVITDGCDQDGEGGGGGKGGLQTKLRSRLLTAVAYLMLCLASWEPLTRWFQIEPSLLRSSGVRRTYWLVSIVLPWKSQRSVELEPTPVGRDTGTDRCVKGQARTRFARGREPTELL